jgi:integrase
MIFASSASCWPALTCRRSSFMISVIRQPACCKWAQHVPARVVMEILGHSQIALTMNTYSHVAPEVSREAAYRMARALWHDEDQADDYRARERGSG